jgi:hypothetical protein
MPVVFSFDFNQTTCPPISDEKVLEIKQALSNLTMAAKPTHLLQFYIAERVVDALKLGNYDIAKAAYMEFFTSSLGGSNSVPSQYNVGIGPGALANTTTETYQFEIAE